MLEDRRQQHQQYSIPQRGQPQQQHHQYGANGGNGYYEYDRNGYGDGYGEQQGWYDQQQAGGRQQQQQQPQQQSGGSFWS